VIRTLAGLRGARKGVFHVRTSQVSGILGGSMPKGVDVKGPHVNRPRIRGGVGAKGGRPSTSRGVGGDTLPPDMRGPRIVCHMRMTRIFDHPPSPPTI